MNNYITGTTIKELREKRNMTQLELGNLLGVSDKTISKWETSKGFPDISLIEPLSKELGVSVIELFTGDCISNQNIASNMLKTKLYVCPVCGNVIHSIGETIVSCCGITLPVLESEESDSEHEIHIEVIDNEYFIWMEHPMTKQHFIAFFAYATADSFELVKLYPEGAAQVRFRREGHGKLYAYCNKHGLTEIRV